MCFCSSETLARLIPRIVQLQLKGYSAVLQTHGVVRWPQNTHAVDRAPHVVARGALARCGVLRILMLVDLLSITMAGCLPTQEDLAAVEYAPLAGEDWKVSTTAEQGLDPDLVAEHYLNTAQLPNL